MKRRKMKSQNKSLKKHQKSFNRLWKVTDSPPLYDALTDKHASYYFASESLRKHIGSLSRAFQKQNRSSSNIKVSSNIERSRVDVRKFLGVHEKCEYFKIAPYADKLKPCSRLKLTQFKENRESSQRIKQKQHIMFLKTHWNTKKPDKPIMRIVRTLQPIEKFLASNKLSTQTE